MKSTLEGHTDCLLTKLEGSAGAHFRIEPTCVIITLSRLQSSVFFETKSQKKWYTLQRKEFRGPVVRSTGPAPTVHPLCF
jgi:hypothetical protein